MNKPNAILQPILTEEEVVNLCHDLEEQCAPKCLSYFDGDMEACDCGTVDYNKGLKDGIDAYHEAIKRKVEG